MPLSIHRSDQLIIILQSAQEKLALACIGVSSSTQEDVELMSKVVFALFNNELVKVSLKLDHRNI